MFETRLSRRLPAESCSSSDVLLEELNRCCVEAGVIIHRCSVFTRSTGDEGSGIGAGTVPDGMDEELLQAERSARTVISGKCFMKDLG